MRERERGRCLHLVTAAACGEEEDKGSLAMRLSSVLYSSLIVYSATRGLSWFFPPLWVFHVISCVSTVYFLFFVYFVHTSSFRWWPNELGNQILSVRWCEITIGKLDTVGDEGIREPGDLSLNRSCIGWLGESGCPPVEGNSVGGS